MQIKHFFIALGLLLMLSACGSSGGPPANNWDKLTWDKGSWG